MAKTPAKAVASKPKRPRDFNQLAHQLVRESTEQNGANLSRPSSEEISRVMADLGRRGGVIGGKKRAEALTASKRREIALKAARTRWDKQSASS